MEDPLNGKYLGIISSDFVSIADRLYEASLLIRQNNFSPYPIFLMAKQPLNIGQLLIKKNEVANQWYYYAAYADLLIQTALIQQDRLKKFQQHYKNPDEFCCLLVFDAEFINFVYIPYPADIVEENY